MNSEELGAALKLVDAQIGDDWQDLPEGKTLTLHAASNGVGLSLSRVVALRLVAGQVQTRNMKGDLSAVAAADVFACTLDGGSSRSRKAGFST